MNEVILFDRPWIARSERLGSRAAATGESERAHVRDGRRRPMRVILEDAALLILLVAMVPVAILIVGAPVALAIRAILALVERL